MVLVKLIRLYRQFLLSTIFVCYSGLALAQIDLPSYQVQAGDLMEIIVWKEPELSKELLVAPDGFINIPLAGPVNTKGRTLDELRLDVTNKLAQFITSPSITLNIKAAMGNKIYVMGKVVRPGEIMLNQPTDVIQCLSKAGGFTPYADVNDIKIIRRIGDAQQVSKFNYHQVERGKHLEQNIILQNGDIVVVP
jgi:polysaccharide biosynthesis/export protein